MNAKYNVSAGNEVRTVKAETPEQAAAKGAAKLFGKYWKTGEVKDLGHGTFEVVAKSTAWDFKAGDVRKVFVALETGEINEGVDYG